MVESSEYIGYLVVYFLMKLALLLHVAMTNFDRVFSVIKIIKNVLHNRIGDKFMNDCFVTYIEQDITKLRMKKFCNIFKK